MGGVRVLVSEDEPRMADLLRRGLGEEGHDVEIATTGTDALSLALADDFDVLVLDVMLPHLSGVDVCRRLRAQGIVTPVLLLTALGSVEDRVAGLDAGADDYLPKPFAFSELLARLRALARRSTTQETDALQVGDLRLEPATRQVRRGNQEVVLSATEFALLEAFMRRPGEVLERWQLLDSAWDPAYENRSNVVDVYVRYLREKIDRPFGRSSLQTVRGAGYRLRADG